MRWSVGAGRRRWWSSAPRSASRPSTWPPPSATTATAAWSAPSSTRPRSRAPAQTAEAGLADLVTILEGDARETLADLPGPIGFVLLDGWKRLYLPVLRLLEPRLTPGALVVADDTVSMAAQMTDYLSYVRDPARGYLSVSFPESDGLEITCRI